jgi:predicted metalloprotease
VDDYIIISEVMATKIWLGQVGSYGQTSDRSGDFSVAFAVAHEYAHNLQHELSLYSAQLPVSSYELHADCWAGVWANGAYYEGILEPGDIAEALDAAALVGEYEFDDPNHHGTPAERQNAFMTGYNSGQPPACNTFLQ